MSKFASYEEIIYDYILRLTNYYQSHVWIIWVSLKWKQRDYTKLQNHFNCLHLVTLLFFLRSVSVRRMLKWQGSNHIKLTKWKNKTKSVASIATWKGCNCITKKKKSDIFGAYWKKTNILRLAELFCDLKQWKIVETDYFTIILSTLYSLCFILHMLKHSMGKKKCSTLTFIHHSFV